MYLRNRAQCKLNEANDIVLSHTYEHMTHEMLLSQINKSSGATALQGLGRQSGRHRSAKIVPTFADRGVSRGQRNGSPRPLISVYGTWIATYFIQVTPQLTSRGSRGWVYPVPDPLLLRKSGSAGNRTRDLCICSQNLWPLDHRGCYLKLHIYNTIDVLLFHTIEIYFTCDISLSHTI